MRVAVLVWVCALAGPIAAGAQAPAPPAWQAPIPAEGAIFTVVAGTPLAFTLSAVSADPGSVLHVAGSGLPEGATLTSADGNPGTAEFRWTPRAGQVGDYAVVFTATPSGDVPVLTPDRDQRDARAADPAQRSRERLAGGGRPATRVRPGASIRGGAGRRSCGDAAFGTSAKSPVPTGYFAGAFIGIYGTNTPEYPRADIARLHPLAERCDPAPR